MSNVSAAALLNQLVAAMRDKERENRRLKRQVDDQRSALNEAEVMLRTKRADIEQKQSDATNQTINQMLSACMTALEVRTELHPEWTGDLRLEALNKVISDPSHPINIPLIESHPWLSQLDSPLIRSLAQRFDDMTVLYQADHELLAKLRTSADAKAVEIVKLREQLEEAQQRTRVRDERIRRNEQEKDALERTLVLVEEDVRAKLAAMRGKDSLLTQYEQTESKSRDEKRTLQSELSDANKRLQATEKATEDWKALYQKSAVEQTKLAEKMQQLARQLEESESMRQNLEAEHMLQVPAAAAAEERAKAIASRMTAAAAQPQRDPSATEEVTLKLSSSSPKPLPLPANTDVPKEIVDVDEPMPPSATLAASEDMSVNGIAASPEPSREEEARPTVNLSAGLTSDSTSTDTENSHIQ